MKVWSLLSEPYDIKEPILDDGTGPSVNGKDAFFVVAETRSKANYLYQHGYIKYTDVRDYLKTSIVLSGDINLPPGLYSLEDKRFANFMFMNEEEPQLWHDPIKDPPS